ncbi:MAG: LLM class flavin-dependent oxidoreductase [Candidatus Hodarchaeota archaeon]
MKFAINVPNYEEYSNPNTLVELAFEAEQAGWDAFFLWDHMIIDVNWKVAMADPWVALGAMAVKTKHIRLGAMITPLARRRPWKVAREIISLDHLSRGRVIFGVGLGAPEAEFTAFGEEENPKIRAEKLDEGLDIITGLWKGEAFSYTGKHYKIDNVTFLPRPIQTPRIPIWVGGGWPNKPAFKRATKWDGVVPVSAAWPKRLTSQDAKDIVVYIKKYRTTSDPFDICIGGETPSDSIEAAKIIKPFINAGITWWTEDVNDMRGSLNEMRERIKAGPPKI